MQHHCRISFLSYENFHHALYRQERGQNAPPADETDPRTYFLHDGRTDRFLRAAKEYSPREHAMFLFAVAHGGVFRRFATCGCRM
jgi:hypothetical protein